MAQKVQVIGLNCSRCWAQPTEPCKGAKGQPVAPHERREQITVVEVCDLCDDEQEAMPSPFPFAVAGQAYELDVCGDHWSWCMDQLTVMVGSARRAGRGAAVPAPRSAGRKSRRDPRALTVPCLRCDAGPGQRCVRPSGQETGEPHSERRHSAVASDLRQMRLGDQ